MKVLIVNPIIYTSETRDIKKVNTIKDTMIYDLCLAFIDKGIDVTLAAGDLYKPTQAEDYPFKVEWLKIKNTKLFPPHSLPFCPDVIKLAKNGSYDLIITSEVFSLNSLLLSIKCKDKLIVWHELAKHNKIFNGKASRFWYGVIAKIFFKDTLIVPRSNQAKTFISQYCNRVSNEIIDHGVNLNIFIPQKDKDNYFVVSSQLIQRKHIEKIIDTFSRYIKKYDKNAMLIIMGDGDKRSELEKQTNDLCISNNIEFTGKLNHSELMSKLAGAKATLIYTEKDNNMISIVESIAVGTPIITTSIPYNSSYIKANKLGIVNDNWSEEDLLELANNTEYINNCLEYRKTLATTSKVEQFIQIKEKYLDK